MLVSLIAEGSVKGVGLDMLRKRLFNAAFRAVCICLIISLIMNDVYSKRINREHQYKHRLYNQLIFDVYMADPAHSNFPNVKRAAVSMAYAASVLNDLYIEASVVDNANMTITQPIEEAASFVSYISLALVGQNETYLTGPGNKHAITITPNQAKNLVRRINQLILKNVVNGSDIPNDKINAVYRGIDDLIPEAFKSIPGGVFDSVSIYH